MSSHTSSRPSPSMSCTVVLKTTAPQSKQLLLVAAGTTDVFTGLTSPRGILTLNDGLSQEPLYAPLKGAVPKGFRADILKNTCSFLFGWPPPAMWVILAMGAVEAAA